MIPARVRPGIVASVAAVALIGGAGVALAATSSSSGPSTRAATAAASPSPTPSPTRCPAKGPWRGMPRPGRAFGVPFAPPGAGFGPFGTIHGQFVMPKSGGGYQTIDTQRGTVTAVSSSSITVKSSDGFTKTYQVTSSTNVAALRSGIGSVKTGQTVMVLATVSGSSATATHIVDFSALPRLPKMPQVLKPGSHHGFRIGQCLAWRVSR